MIGGFMQESRGRYGNQAGEREGLASAPIGLVGLKYSAHQFDGNALYESVFSALKISVCVISFVRMRKPGRLQRSRSCQITAQA